MLAWVIGHLGNIALTGIFIGVIFVVITVLAAVDNFGERRPIIFRSVSLGLFLSLWAICSGTWSAIPFAIFSIGMMIALVDSIRHRERA